MKIAHRLWLTWFLLGAQPAFAGYVLTYDLESFSDKANGPRHCITTLFVEKDRIRSETACPKVSRKQKAFTMITIYRADPGILWSINPKSRKYSEVKEDEMATQGETEQAAFRTLGEDRLKKFRDDGYEADERGVRPIYHYTKTHRLLKIRDWQCWGYESHRCKLKTGDLCVADINEVFSHRVDPMIAKMLQKTFGLMVSTESEALEKAHRRAFGETAFFLRNAAQLNGTPISTLEFMSVAEKPLSPDLFTLPPGLTRSPAPFAGN